MIDTLPIIKPAAFEFKRPSLFSSANSNSSNIFKQTSSYSRFTAEAPKPSAPQEEEEDPLDAFMKDISSQAAVQNNLPNATYNEDEEDEEGSVDFSKNKNVITMDDILGDGGENTETNDNDDESQELFRQQFMAAFKRQEHMQKEILGLDDDDDKFIIGLQGGQGNDPDEEGYVDA